MTDLAKLVVRLEAQTAKYQNELEKSQKKLDRFARRSETTASKIGKGVGAGLAVATTALSAMIGKMIVAGDRLDKLSTRLGISTENLSRLQFAAELTGVSATTLNTAMQRLERRIDEVAKTGRGEALPALNELGLSAKKLGELTPEQQLLALADSFQTVTDQGTRVRLAMKLFDTEGVALLQTMEGGSTAIAALAAESDLLGNTINTNTAKQAARLNDSITRFQGAANGAAQELLKNLGPQIESAATALQVVLPKAAQIASASFFNLQGAMFGAAGAFQTAVAKFGSLSSKFLKAVDPKLFGAFGFAFDDLANEAAPKADILFKLMNDRFKTGLELLNQTVEVNAPALESIIPDIANLSGTNPTSQDDAAANRVAVENEKIVSLQQEKFRRIHEMALQAEGQTRTLEQERFARELELLQKDRERLEQRGLLTAEVNAQFRTAEENAERAHQGNLTKIQEDEQKVRNDLRKAQLQAAGDFFGALGNLAKEGSKAQRILLAAEKAAALGRSLIALQVAIAKANAVGFPANIPAIAQATAVGASAIASIRSVNVSGARGGGGSVRAGQSVVVGEFGPEVATFGGAGMVTPNNRLGGGDLIVNLYENPERAGTVERDGNMLRIFVNQIRNELTEDMSSGRGFGRALENIYPNLRRRTA